MKPEEKVVSRLNELGGRRPKLVKKLQEAFMCGDWRGVQMQASELAQIDAAMKSIAETLQTLALGVEAEAKKKGKR
jgi:hypothetical protein